VPNDRAAVDRHELEAVDRGSQLPRVDDDVDLLLPITSSARERFAHDRQDCIAIERGGGADRDLQLLFP
jgi:hypothetical protein